MAKKKKQPARVRPPVDEKLIHRFYEPLILLCALGRNRGDYESNSMPRTTNVRNLSPKDTRRLFLSQLAYLCDRERGGDSVTAIGVERIPERAIFHVAANSDPTPQIVAFVKDLLFRLVKVYDRGSDRSTALQQLIPSCIEFARPRVKANNKLLWKNYQLCQEHDKQKPPKDRAFQKLSPWLEKFRPGQMQNEELCKTAYDDRLSDNVRLLESLSRRPHRDSSMRESPCPFRMLRHYIGRLGSQIKAVNIILNCMPRVRHLLDDFEVNGIPTPTRSSPPLIREETNLNGILRRMLPSQSGQLAGLQDTIAEMDQKFLLQEFIEKEYRDENFEPRVHAEVQVLDFFTSNELNFEDSDRFIACSKPACYCCLLYFRHHPDRPELPPSHQTIHKNWRPPDSKGVDTMQRDIMNKVIPDIRREALRHIEEKRPRRAWQPDSTTGITQSDAGSYVCSETESLDERSSVPERLEYLSSSSSCQFEDEMETLDTTSSFESSREHSSPNTIPTDHYESEDNSEAEGGVSLAPLMKSLDLSRAPEHDRDSGTDSSS